jgi:hypothetical protein
MQYLRLLMSLREIFSCLEQRLSFESCLEPQQRVQTRIKPRKR